MFTVTIALAFACFVGKPAAANTDCHSMTCHNLASSIRDSMKNIKFPGRTRANHVTNCKLIKCNMNIFEKELDEAWQCKDTSNNSNECLFLKRLKCIPHSCKVLHTTCEDPDKNSFSKYTPEKTMAKFIGTVSRELKSREEEGNSCEHKQRKKRHYY